MSVLAVNALNYDQAPAHKRRKIERSDKFEVSAEVFNSRAPLEEVASKASALCNHVVLFQSKLNKTPETAQIVLIAEAHGDMKCVEAQNKLIQELMGPNEAVLLLEGAKFDEAQFGGKAFDLSRFNLIEINRLKVSGWDFKLIKGMVGLIERLGKLAFESPDKLYRNKQLIRILNLILASFPARNNAMIDSIHSVEQWIAKTNFQGKVFIIAGVSHLSQKSSKDVSRYSLVNLYKELEKYDAVILKPKHLEEIVMDCTEKFLIKTLGKKT